MRTIKISECRATPEEQYKKTPMYSEQKVGEDEEGKEIRAKRPIMVGDGDAAQIQTYGMIYAASAKDTRVKPDALETLRKHLIKKGDWGIGCPECQPTDSAPFFLQLRVSDDGKGWVPEDPAAWTPSTPTVMERAEIEGETYYLVETRPTVLEWVKEVPTVYGYLNWRPQPDGGAIFTCPRCKGEVRLEP